MTTAAAIVLASLAIYGFVVVTAILWLRMSGRALDTRGLGYTPPVSILKPIKGLDEGLEENLESFAALDYPRYQLIVGFADADDPAVPVARAVAARHPELDMQVLVGEVHIGRNPKVNLLEAMLPHAKHELCLISDSNVRAHARYLRRTVAAMDDPEVGVVSNPVVGTGELTSAAAMENLHLSTFLAAVNIAAKALVGIDAVVGKSMLFRKRALEQMGGFHAVRNVLAEDQLIGKKMVEAGWKVRLVGEPVQNVNTRWSLRQLAERHARWARIRIRLVPWTYPLEIVGSPVVLAVLFTLFGVSGGPWLLAGALAGKVAIDAVASLGIRGSLPGRGGLLLAPFKDLVLFGVWFVPFFSSEVSWRGTTLRITKGTRLVSREAYSRAKAIARASRTAQQEERESHRPLDAAA